MVAAVMLFLPMAAPTVASTQAYAQASAPAPARPARNACFVRVQALRTIPGLSTAVPAGEALNAAGGGGAPALAVVQRYDAALESAITAMGASPDVAMRLLDAESLVDRIAECGRQIGVDASQIAAASIALDEAFRRNADHYSLQSPNLVDDYARRRLQERMLASARLEGALASVGRAGERQAVLDQQLALVARARAEADARWEAERPQREAAERARWAAINAEERRQLSAEATPDERLLTRAIMQEFHAVAQGMTSLIFAQALSSFTQRPGERPGLSEYWNHDAGQASLLFGNDQYAMGQNYRITVRDVSCRPAARQAHAHDCTFTAQTAMEVTIGGSTILDFESGRVQLTTPIVWNGARWSAPRVRAAMERGVAASAIAPTSRGVIGSDNGLCSSLQAGVVAAGGSSTSTALNPSTWGC